MKKSKIWISLGILLIVLVAVVIGYNMNKVKKDQPLKVTGVEFTPNVYLENNKIAGIDTEIASKALENAGVKFEIAETLSRGDK